MKNRHKGWALVLALLLVWTTTGLAQHAYSGDVPLPVVNLAADGLAAAQLGQADWMASIERLEPLAREQALRELAMMARDLEPTPSLRTAVRFLAQRQESARREHPESHGATTIPVIGSAAAAAGTLNFWNLRHRTDQVHQAYLRNPSRVWQLDDEIFDRRVAQRLVAVHELNAQDLLAASTPEMASREAFAELALMSGDVLWMQQAAVATNVKTGSLLLRRSADVLSPSAMEALAITAMSRDGLAGQAAAYIDWSRQSTEMIKSALDNHSSGTAVAFSLARSVSSPLDQSPVEAPSIGETSVHARLLDQLTRWSADPSAPPALRKNAGLALTRADSAQARQAVQLLRAQGALPGSVR